MKESLLSKTVIGVLLAFSLSWLTPISANANGLGGYAVIHPDGYVCGVIVATSSDPYGNGGVMATEYMGCPSGSPLVFQTKPSPTGNVAGWHGRDVLYSNGTFRLSSGTTITNGIATDTDGRVWDTGSGETITPAPTPGNSSGTSSSPVDSGTTTSSSPSSSNSETSSTTSVTPTPTPSPTPMASEPTVSGGTFSPQTVQVGKQLTATFEISDRSSKANLGEDSVYCSVSSVRVRARLSAGNYTGGNWYCEITIPTSTTSGDYSVTAEVSGIGNTNIGTIKVVTEAIAEWTPPADSTATLNDYDDTYNRICLTLGWTECGIWTIYNANGLQMNRVVGPYPLAKLVALGCQNSRVDLCGGEPKGYAVLNGLYSRTPSTQPASGSTSSSSNSSQSAQTNVTETAVVTATADATKAATAAVEAADKAAAEAARTTQDTSTVIVPVIPETSTTTAVPQVSAPTQTRVTTSSGPAPEVDSDGVEEAPIGNLTVRLLSNGRYRMTIDTNLDSEVVAIRATKRGARSIRFQVTVNEDGRVVINTTRNLEGFRLVLTFEDTILATTRVG